MTRPEIPAWVCTLVALVAITVLAALGHPIPPVLEVVAGGAAGGALGITAPTNAGTASSGAPSASPGAPPSS